MGHLPVVEVEHLCYSYPASRRGDAGRMALRDVSFSIGKGEVFALLGPNGGGKTTLFKILSTLLPPTSGRATILQRDVRANSHEIRQKIGVAFQSPGLDKKLTVEENLVNHGHLYRLWGQELRVRIREILKRLGLEERAKDLVETLSGGMCRRVELAKTLLHRPEVLILDEPSTGLDPGARRDLWHYLKMLRENDGVTALITTHLMEEAAGCDRLALLDRGQVVALGSPDLLTSEIGGDVITVRTEDPEVLAREIQARFGGEPTILDGNVRIECRDGHKFIPLLVEALPGKIESISFGKPTLEDVFIHRTGHRLWEE